ncbi:sulfite exporter TauE/SafE family protein [Microvirga sp. HBU67558]|uniref:HoxN/HupN/NixA family nickel/cobalt transporter n=1 Tax=Microvirga TaxID=186650 RepID=UPI001B378678|nr:MULTISPECIES: sulfite exporter TauE/SafE family protein [unclassified Microvirga]MBQ0821910.1 sulfite exporter TauE/SafE family protein [Microvirga sp. HBU67558]
MPDIAQLLQSGGNRWLHLPFAVLLGALHGLEPGHSKTMMAAYIVAIRGTIGQAILLGVCAALSHSLVVWIVAMAGLSFGREILNSHFEAWLLITSGVIIIGIAAWMFWRTGQSIGWFRRHHHGHHHHHNHDHDGHHHDEVRTIDTGHGIVELSVFEDGVPPRWRLRTLSGHGWAPQDVTAETERPDGSRQAFAFVDQGSYLESVEEIPEPHAFTARMRLSHGDHAHTYAVTFAEHDHDHHHDHAHLDEDAHEREHAEQIARQLAANGGNVTTVQIALFGITGGLIPCPASITVLLICLQLGQFTLGAATVAAFSLGLAITMVSIGVAAAWGIQHASKKINFSDRLLRRLPLASAGLVGVLGAIMLVQGFVDLAAPATALS